MGICIDLISDFTVILAHIGEMGGHCIVEVLPFKNPWGEGNPVNSFFIVIVYLSQVWKLFLLYYPLNLSSRFLVREGGTFST